MSGPPLTLLDGVRWEGRELTGGRGAALLAALAAASPRALGVDDLVERVWADDAPAHPDKAVQVLVSRARSQTAPEVVVRVGAGYRLGLREDQVDALRLRQLLTGARTALAAGDLDVARLQAQEADGLAITTAADGPLGALVDDARRQQEAARDLLGSVLLARGDTDAALPLLEEASARHPGDEHRLAELLRAEARVRGVAAALARWAAYAEEMRDRVGAEPGEELRRLHADLLARDRPVRSGLAHAATPLVGRDDDVARIRGLLERSRVVSVVGAGGLGKTRMAHLVGQVAEQPVVHLVELAGVTAPEDVLPEIGAALGVRDSVTGVRSRTARTGLRDRVAEQLTGPPTLLVLDNCEHLVRAVADVVAFLVATVRTVTVLTTSRAPLGLAAEQVYLLPQLDDDDAAELFAQRARSARPGVRLDDAEVRALVARLDGLPLAIELAAAKVRVMSVAEITRRLEDRFALLAGRDPSAPDRHQTLEAVIDWSWNLLGEPERSALRTLVAFPDGFSLEGAEVLLGTDPVPVLTELVDQSLLVVHEGERLRYRFLETVREYGARRLERAGALADVHARLRAWGVGVARAASHRLFGPDQVATMQDLHAEAGNLAGVLRGALEDRDAAAVAPLAGALIGYWTIRGDHLTVMTSAEELLAVVSAAPAAPEHAPELRGVLASLVATSTVFRGTPPAAGVQRLRDLGLAGDGSRTDALAHVVLTVVTSDEGPTAALDALTEDPDPVVARLALQWSTLARENVGELQGALDVGLRAVALCDDGDGPWTRSLLHAQISSLYSQRGDWAHAVEHAVLAVPVMRAVGAEEDVLSLRGVVAMAALAAGRVAEGSRLVAELVAEDVTTMTVGWRTNALGLRAEVAIAQGRVDEGLALFLECLDATTERRLAGVDVDTALMPWVLYAEASALFAHVRHGRADQVRWLVDQTRAKVPLLPMSQSVDLPVLGSVLVALGAWACATGEGDPDAAVELVALGHRFGYPRYLPTFAWPAVCAVVDPVAPGRLEELTDLWAGVPAQDLRDRALATVAKL